MRLRARTDANALVAAVKRTGSLDGAAADLRVSRATLSRWLNENGRGVREILRDRTGETFGRWTILSSYLEGARSKAVCRCSCGTEKTLHLSAVVHGGTFSCGCYRSENTTEQSTKHGRCGSPEYIVWLGMKARCCNPNASNFRFYGARGVSICERWLAFENFISDMGEKPSPDHTIDRINPFGDYEPSNCRWVTWDVQVANKRSAYAG
jgi:hypothetical protein